MKCQLIKIRDEQFNFSETRLSLKIFIGKKRHFINHLQNSAFINLMTYLCQALLVRFSLAEPGIDL